MPETTYKLARKAKGSYEAIKVIDGKECPGSVGTLTGSHGRWEAEWVDGSRVGQFPTLHEGAKALGNYLAVICN